MKKSIAILGVNSFSGAWFANYLLSKEYSVTGFYRSRDVDDLFLPYLKAEQAPRSEFQMFNVNLLTDYENIAETIKEKQIDTVVNFAAQSMVAESWITPHDWYDTNVSAFSKLLTALNKSIGKKLMKFVQFSTPEVYGSTNGLIKENWNFNPTTPYAISRAASDFHLRALNQQFDFPVIFTRAANVYGPHQRIYRVIPKIIVKALKSEPFELHGGGTSLRSFVHIEDVCKGVLRIIQEGEIGASYHISTNDFVSILELTQEILGKLGIEFTQVVKVVGDRQGKDNAYLLDSSKIRSDLEWQEEISLSDGIDQVIGWVKGNWNKIQTLNSDYLHTR